MQTPNSMKLTRALLACTVFLGSFAFASDANARGYHGYGHGGHHYGHSRHYRHHGHHGAYLAGGLILGSLLTHAYHERSEPVVVYREVLPERVSASLPVKVGRRLFRDRDGNCFERSTTVNGDELSVELDPRECAW